MSEVEGVRWPLHALALDWPAQNYLLCLARHEPLQLPRKKKPTFAPMDSTRQQKFAKQIQREIGDIFLKDGKNYFGNAFVTVTQVRVTSDLGEARIHLSMFKQQNPNALLEQIRKHKGEIRKLLGQKIKDTIHHIPNLLFFIDDSLDYAEKINTVMKDIQIPDETKINPDDYKEERGSKFEV